MAASLAKGAQAILDARLKGKRPADMVIVSLSEAINEPNPIVYAKAGQHYDWRWVLGLDVCVYVTNEDEWVSTLRDIALCRPEHLELWNWPDQWGSHVTLVPTAEDVAKPRSMWRFDLAFTLWMDFQNTDFIESRRYARDASGMPYRI